MLLRKCLILLALFSFSAVPMMGCTPGADDAGAETETEEDTTGDADPGESGDDAGTDDETENGNGTNTNTD